MLFRSQVGGSIGTAALSTVALTATATYLAAHHAGRLAQATAAVHGYNVAFTVSAALFAVGALVAFLLLPTRRRMQDRWNAAIVEVTPAVTQVTAPAVAADEVVLATSPADQGAPAVNGPAGRR